MPILHVRSSYLTVSLQVQDFCEVIVDEEEARSTS